jgi:AraC-like DNA-binding protein
MKTCRALFFSHQIIDMLFRSYKPVPPLSDFIENLWIYRGFASSQLKERIFPSGTFELVFNLRDDELRIYKPVESGRYLRLSGAIVSGPYEGFFVADTAEEACVIGVHFKPAGAFPFLGLSAYELTDMHIDLEAVWGRSAAEIREQLCGTTTSVRRFQFLEKALLSRLSRAPEHHPAVSLALEGFRFDNSRGVVRKLARDAGLSDRRFIDVFNSEVGLKPKLFNRVQRFQRVLARVHQSPSPNWGELALDHGYFDQSHLIRDFHAFSGFSPADYLRRLRDLRLKGLGFKFNHLPVAD